ncbi:MAG: NAD(+)/NADH kinase [Bradymonadaceae bacterium]
MPTPALPSAPRVLVTYKKSRLEYHGSEDSPDAGSGGSGLNDELEEAHRAHRRSIERVTSALETSGLDYESIYRGQLQGVDTFDLVVTVGGDGTVLDVSHKVFDTPLLAINSHPNSSVGYFCAGRAPEFPDLLERAIDGELPAFDLERFDIELDGRQLKTPVLNEVLVAHQNPAGVARYTLQPAEGGTEEQRSSGIWISTPAGSTGAIRSAGGFILPLDSDYMEYLVREPYPHSREVYRHERGVQSMDHPFEVTSRMEKGRIFLDGPHVSHPFPPGDVLRIGRGEYPITIYGLDERRRAR